MYNVKKFVDKNFSDYKLASAGKEAVVTCIWCYPKSDKRKLYISLENGLFHCFVCGKKGNFLDLAKEVKKLKSTINLNDYKDGKVEKKNEHIQIVSREISPPIGFRTIDSLGLSPSEHHPGRDYLLARGITLSDISFFNIGFCGVGPLSNRVVIPVYTGDKILVGYIARDITGKSKTKVMTPAAVPGTHGIKDYIFNFDTAVKTDHLIITEGVFDSISVGVRGIALFGKEATKIQLYQIINSKVKRITIALDPDARREAEKLANTLKMYYTDVRLAIFPEGEDPNSLSRDILNQCLNDAQRVNFLMDPLIGI